MLRDIRCPHCGQFVMRIRGLKVGAGSHVVLEITVRCRNRKCRHDICFDTCLVGPPDSSQKKELQQK